MKRRGRAYSVRFRRMSWPDRLFVKMKYTTGMVNTSLGTTAGAALFAYAGNGLFDPDLQTGGHQPYGLDQYNGLYNSYMVYASKIRVYAEAQNVGYLQVAVVPNTDSAPFNISTEDYLWEVPNLRYKICRSAVVAGSPADIFLPPKSVVIKHYAKTKKMYINTLTWNSFTAAFGANPATMWRWNVIYKKLGGPVYVINYEVQLKYYVMFMDRLQPNPS